MIIYKATNIINGKIYIGQTINLKKRIKKHFNEAKKYKKYLFPRALIKYGKENFIWEVIDYASSKEELNEKEIFWIWINDSTNPKYGYNICLGGHLQLSPEREKKRILSLIKKVYQYDIKTGEFIKEYNSVKEVCKYFNDTGQVISKVCRKDKYCQTAFGYRWSYEKKEYIKIETNKKKVEMYDLNMNFLREFESLSDAARFLNKDITSAIAKVCKGEMKHSQNYIWRYKEIQNDD